MSQVILISSGKGGTGKTIFAANVGVILSQRGFNVLLIDMDLGLRNLDLVLGLESKIVYDVRDVCSGLCSISQATISHKNFPNLHFMAASPVREDGEITPLHMQVLCRKLKSQFDYIIIDGPAGINDGLIVAAADAAFTSLPGRVLAILTADCLPVVMADDQGTVLGVAHAGWRGLASGVLENTLASMRLRQAHAKGFRAWIGPGIGPTVFQVGEDVRRAFQGHGAELPAAFVPDPSATGKWLADLPALARYRLARAGVEQIETSGACTVTDPLDRFYSYRRDKVTGRMATLAWLETDANTSLDVTLVR